MAPDPHRARPDPDSELDLRDPLERLTPAERRVADLVLTGARNQDVAHALGISERTVESHLASAFKKVGVRSRTQLVTSVLRPTALLRPSVGADEPR